MIGRPAIAMSLFVDAFYTSDLAVLLRERERERERISLVHSASIGL